MEYCGIKTSNVKGSTKTRRSKSGNLTKPRRSHSRRRCYKTDDKSLNTSECMVGISSRCVIRGNNPELLERRRSKNRTMYLIRSKDGNMKKSVKNNLPVVSRVKEPVVSRLEEPVVSRVKEPVVSRVEEPVVSRVEEPVVSRVEEPVVSRVEEPVVSRLLKNRQSRKSKSSSVLSEGPYVFNFVADTNFPKRKGSKETTLSKVQKYYNEIITKNKSNPNYKNIDTFNVDSVDETEYKGTLTLNVPPSSVKELNELIENILSPDFILEGSDVHIFPDYIIDSLELDGKKLNQAGGRKKKILRY